jgi:hypothetical protein
VATTFATLKADMQRHLNDRAGLMFADETELKTALKDALREIALIRDPKSRKEVFPREFMAFMAEDTDPIEAKEDDIIELPTDSLRIIGGHIGASDIVAVKGMDYEWRKNEAITIPTLGEPWLVSKGQDWQIWPVGHWYKTDLKAVIRYVKDPPPYESAHPAIVRAMTYLAARNMAFDKEKGNLGSLLQQRGMAALSTAIGIPFLTQQTEDK